MLKAAFYKPYPEVAIRKEAKNALREWAEGFRKNRTGKPFLTSEIWRASLFPGKSKAQVYQGDSTTFKAKVPLVTLQVDASKPSTSKQQLAAALFGESDSSLSDLDVVEKDIADEDDHVLSPASTPPRVSDEEASYSSYRTGDQSYQASDESEEDERDDNLVGSDTYRQICEEVQQNLNLEEQAGSMDVDPNPEPSAADVARRQQEEEEAARRLAALEAERNIQLQM